MYNPAHPAEIIVAYMDDMSSDELATSMGVSIEVVHGILREEKPIDETIAGALAKVFETSPLFWQNLQSQYDMAQKKHG